MARHKLQPDTPERGSIASLLSRMSGSFGTSATTAEEYSKSWRFLTFVDPKTGLPSIAHEYIVGASGFRAGTVNQLRGLAGTGKSSLIMLEYASAIQNGGAYCAHLETEGSGMSSDRVAEFGVSPDSLVIPDEVDSFESAVSFVDTFRCLIRGGLGGTVNDMGRKSATKFLREDADDPGCSKPILIGIDSLSNLAKEDDANLDVTDPTKAKPPGWLPRQIKAWLREKAKRYEKDLLTLFLTSQETVKISTGPGAFGPPEKTCVAGDAIKFFDSTAIGLSIKDWKDRYGNQIGREMMLSNFKSKISGATGRRVSFFLTDHDGFDMVHTDAEFLLGKSSPFSDGAGLFKGDRLCYRHSGGISCRPLSDKSFKTEEEFVRAFYDNRDIVDTCRDWLRIKGYGLPHENKYKAQFRNGVYVGGPSGQAPSETEPGGEAGGLAESGDSETLENG